MKRFTLATCCALAGFLAGFLVCSHGWIQYARLLRQGGVAEYIAEQQALSNRLSIERRDFDAAVHARNAADADAGVGFMWLERSRQTGYWDWFRQPWIAGSDLFLGKLWEMVNSVLPEDGRKIVEAEDRARAAVLFERTSCPELAAGEWRAAESLHAKWSNEAKREEQRRAIPDTSELRRSADDRELAPAKAEWWAAQKRGLEILQQYANGAR